MHDAFERASAACDAPFERAVMLADRTVRLQFAAPTLAARGYGRRSQRSAWRDRRIPTSRSRAGIAASPASCRPSPFARDDFLPNGVVRGHIDDRIRVADDRWMRVISVFDRYSMRATRGFVGEESAVPIWVERAPFRTILRWWGDDSALVPMHASAVAIGDEGVIIAGASGSGKSTTSLARAAAGWQLIADDSAWSPPGRIRAFTRCTAWRSSNAYALIASRRWRSTWSMPRLSSSC